MHQEYGMCAFQALEVTPDVQLVWF